MNPTKLLVISSEAGWHVDTLPIFEPAEEALVNWMMAQGYGSNEWNTHIQACVVTVYPRTVDTEEIHLSDDGTLEAIDEDIFKHHEF